MVLHKDDPDRPGNLTDAEYRAATEALIEKTGDAGLHTVPDDVMADAVEHAKAAQEADDGQ